MLDYSNVPSEYHFTGRWNIKCWIIPTFLLNIISLGAGILNVGLFQRSFWISFYSSLEFLCAWIIISNACPELPHFTVRWIYHLSDFVCFNCLFTIGVYMGICAWHVFLYDVPVKAFYKVPVIIIIIIIIIPTFKSWLPFKLRHWMLDGASLNQPSKHAGSDSHLFRIGWEALARSGPDDSCALACFRTRSVWPKPDSQPELNRIRAGIAQYCHCPGGLWKNGTEAENGKLVAGQLRPARNGPDDSCTPACFQTRCVLLNPD